MGADKWPRWAAGGKPCLYVITMTVMLMTMGLLKLKPCQQCGYRASARLDMRIYLLALSGQQLESESATGSLSLSSALQLPSYLVHHKEGGWVKGWPSVAGMPGGDRRSSGVRSEKREKSHRRTPATSCQRFSRPGQTTGREAPSNGS